MATHNVPANEFNPTIFRSTHRNTFIAAEAVFCTAKVHVYWRQIDGRPELNTCTTQYAEYKYFVQLYMPLFIVLYFNG